MKYAVVYSSLTGNTKLLAETVKKTLPDENCVYFGEPSPKALEADRIYVGFWTDKGNCDEKTAEFLKSINNRELFLFGTAGFGGSEEYFIKVLNKAKENIDETVKIVGTYMCQGKMPMSVRERFVKIKNMPNSKMDFDKRIDNFDKALSHPDENDLDNLSKIIKEQI